MNQSIRIIGGQYRGKKISFPNTVGLRPTPDRIRETLFNWLMHHIHDARCLDAFAGSGALGFEAFSRGASEVVLIEQLPTAFHQLQKTASSFDSSKLTVIHQDARLFMQQTKKTFDLIFLDPPFADNLWLEYMQILSVHPILAPEGLVYLEAPHEVPVDFNHWQLVKLKKAGQVFYGLYKKLDLR